MSVVMAVREIAMLGSRTGSVRGQRTPSAHVAHDESTSGWRPLASSEPDEDDGNGKGDANYHPDNGSRDNSRLVGMGCGYV